ncbi:MAG: methylated-DNA--[protein]-cysteine S-methyltransferase [Candidatus Heimdallarchaeota archaeon]
MSYLYYATFSSAFGTFTIVWIENNNSLRLQRIFLSDHERRSEIKALDTFKQIKIGSSSLIESIGKEIQQFFKGEVVDFNLDLLDFNVCSEAQKNVLIAEYGIPRGWVSTYKRIAIKIGIPNGARAVGKSLAKNPFPIIIPCHRAIKTNGELGGYQGGIKMKRTLLEMEGIKFSEKGKVITKNIYY